MIDCRVARPGHQLTLEGFDALRRTFSQSFDAAVIEIPDKSDHLMASRGSLGKETKPYTLHLAANEESSRYPIGHFNLFWSFILTRRYQLNNRDSAGRNRHRNCVVRATLTVDLQRPISRPFAGTRDH